MKTHSKTERPVANNRLDVLKEVLRYRFIEICSVSIYVTLFFIPAFSWLVFTELTTFFPADNFYSSIVSNLVLAPLIGIGGIGIAGGIRFIKRTVFGEGSVVRTDFFKGIKNEPFKYFLLYTFYGLMIGIMNVVMTVLNNQVESKLVVSIVIGLCLVAFFLASLFVFFYSAQLGLYNAKFTQYLVNSLKFVVGAFLTNIPIFLVVALPVILILMVPLEIVTYISLVVLALFYFGFAILVFTLYSNSLFDVAFNKKAYPEIYRKGLYTTTEETKEEQQDEIN